MLQRKISLLVLKNIWTAIRVRGDYKLKWEKEEKKLQDFYREAILKFGDSAEGAHWSSKDSQNKRFEILLNIAPMKNLSILDFGCGSGAMLDYINSRKDFSNISYTGCDILPEALEIAGKKYKGLPNVRWGEFKDFSDEMFDYILVSGVFNTKMDNNEEYYQDYLKKLWKHASKGLAFNMMSSYVDYYDSELFYEKPEKVFAFVKNNLSPYVVLRNDYQVKPGTVPFEFAVYVYRKS